MKLLRHLKPNKEFSEDTKIVFLGAFKEKFPHAARLPVRVFLYFVRGMATGLAVMIILGGASVYADQKNVGPENVLYPLKRSQELLNLVLTNEEERPELHLKFAERRLHEVSEIRKNNPESPKISGLVKDLEAEMKNSLAAIGNGETEEVFKFEEEREIQKPESESTGEKEREKGLEKDGEARERSQAARVATATVGSAMPAAPSSAEEKKTEEKSGVEARLQVVGVQTSTVSSGMPVAPRAAEKKSEERIGESEVIPRLSRKIPPKFVPICHSFNSLIESREKGVAKIIAENPGFLQKFERKCLPLIAP